MLKTRILLLLLHISFIGMISCENIPANNPFDPESATAIQAPAQLSLLVIFPHLLSQNTLSDLDTIDLIKNDDLLLDPETPNSFQTRSLTEGAQLNADDEGPLILQLQFSDLQPGVYWIRPRVVGFVGGTGARIEVSIAERGLAELYLQNEPFGQIVGELHLKGREPGYFGGSLIRSEDRDAQTVSTENGQFSLSIAPGDHQLRLSAPGYISRSLTDLIEVKSGLETTLTTPIELSYDPAIIRGGLELLDAEGNLQPAQGVNLSLRRVASPGFLPQSFDIQTDNEGAFIAQEIIEGRWTLNIQAPGYNHIQESMRVIPGEVLDLQTLYLSPLQRRVIGRAALLDHPNQGGVQISIQGEATIGGRVDLSVMSDRGSNRFEFPAIPAGQYTLTYSMDGYTPQQSSIEIMAVEESEDSVLDLPFVTLQPRRFQCNFNPLSARSDIDLSIEADDDLNFIRVWYDSTTPPSDSIWEARSDTLISFTLSEGVHEVFCQFATESYVRDQETIYSFASEPINGQILVDLAPPRITFAALLPQPDLIPSQDRIYLPLDDPFFIDIAAYDPLPGSNLDKILIYVNDNQPLEIPYRSRFIGPSIIAGVNRLEVSVVDAVGNESERYELPLLIGDEVAPQSLQPSGPPLQAESTLSANRILNLTFPIHDPEPSLESAPIYIRLSEEGQVPGSWRLHEETEITFTLSEGPDSVRRIVGEAKDAAGRILEVNELLVILDRKAIAPTRLELFEADRLLNTALPIQLSGESISLRIEALGTDENLRAELLPPHEGQCELSVAQPHCLISPLSVTLPNNSLAGELTYQVKLIDEVGNESSPTALTAHIDNLPPQNVYVNALGPLLTQFRQVRVRLESFDATSYELIGDVDRVIESVATFPLERVINLTPGDGEKHVEVIFRDEVGNQAIAHLEFTLDQTPPSLSLEVSNDGEPITAPYRTRETDYDLRIVSSECVESCDLTSRISLDRQFRGISFTTIDHISQPVVLPSESGEYFIYVELMDLAGNVAFEQFGPLKLDLTSPHSPQLRRDYISGHKVRLELTPSSDTDLSYFKIERNIPNVQGNTWSTIALYPAVSDDLFRKNLSNDVISCPLQNANCLHVENCLQASNEMLRIEDRNVIVGQEHFYRVQAVDQLGNASSFSSPLSVGTPLNPPAPQISIIDSDSISIQWEVPEGSVSQTGIFRRFDNARVELSTEEVFLGEAGFTPQNTGEDFSELIIKTQNRDESIIWETATRDYQSGQVSLTDTIGVNVIVRMTDHDEYAVIGSNYAPDLNRFGLTAVWLNEDSRLHRRLEKTDNISYNFDAVAVENERMIVMSYDVANRISFSLLNPNGSSIESEIENTLILDEVLCEADCYTDNVYINAQMLKVGEHVYFTYMHPTRKELYDGIIDSNTLELIQAPRLTSDLTNAGVEQLLFDLGTGPILFFSAEDKILRSIHLDTRTQVELISLSDQDFSLASEPIQRLAISFDEVEFDRSNERVKALLSGTYVALNTQGESGIRIFSMNFDSIQDTDLADLSAPGSEPLNLSDITHIKTIHDLNILDDGSVSFINSRDTFIAGDTNTLYLYHSETELESIANMPLPYYDIFKEDDETSFFFANEYGEITRLKHQSLDSRPKTEPITHSDDGNLFLKDLHRVDNHSNQIGTTYVGHENRKIYQYSGEDTSILLEYGSQIGFNFELKLEVNDEGSPLLFHQVEKDEIYLYDLDNGTSTSVSLPERGEDTLEGFYLTPPVVRDDGTALLSWYSCKDSNIKAQCAISISSYDPETQALSELKTYRSMDMHNAQVPRLYEGVDEGESGIHPITHHKLYDTGDEILVVVYLKSDKTGYMVFNLNGELIMFYPTETTTIDKIIGVIVNEAQFSIIGLGKDLIVDRYKGGTLEDSFSLGDGLNRTIVNADVTECEGGLLCVGFSTIRAIDDEEQIEIFFSTLNEEGALTRTIIYEENIPVGDGVQYYYDSYNLQVYHKEGEIFAQAPINANDDQLAGVLTKQIPLAYRPITEYRRVDQLRSLGLENDLDEDGLTDDLDPCPLVAGILCTCNSSALPSTEIEEILFPDSGSSIMISGSSDILDHTWTRLEENCSQGNQTTYYDQYILYNDSPNERVVNVTANWDGDGFLHILRPPFFATGPHDCIAGNDDDDGDIMRSQISDIIVPAGDRIIVLTSTFNATTAIGSYELTIESEL